MMKSVERDEARKVATEMADSAESTESADVSSPQHLSSDE